MNADQLKKFNGQRQCADKRSLCHAPSYSMHFAKNGLVSACSYTRFMPMGRYPEQNLNEIWFGEQAEGIRKQMRTAEFPAGCSVCAADADAGNFGQMRAVLYEQCARSPVDKWKSKVKNWMAERRYAEYPRVVSFELSNTCNLECVMCLGLLSSSIRKNREKLPPLPQVYGPEFLPQLRPFIPHLDEAKFFGGEPFLIDLYLDIWEMFIELNPRCKIYITTNGTIMNNRVKRIVESLPNFQMVVSLDAIRPETYRQIRVNADYDRVMENLQFFKSVSEKHGRHLIISPTYMTLNAEEYPEIYAFANRENIYFETNILTTPHQLSMAYLPPAELERLLQRWREYPVPPAADSIVTESNRREFEKALKQVEFMLQDQKSFYNHPLGGKLVHFKPANRMESCLFVMLRHTVKSTRDPSLPLQLLELWRAEPDLAGALMAALRRVAVEIYGADSAAMQVFLEAFREDVRAIAGEGEENPWVKKLMNDERRLVRLAETVAVLDRETAVSIAEEVMGMRQHIPVEADFF